MPLISLIVPTIREKLIYRCINKIIETSTNIDYEIIIVTPLDNLSFNNSRIRIIKEEPRLGVIGAIHLGVQYATGKYLMNISDDQSIETDCLKNLIEFMSSHDNELFLGGLRYNNLWSNTADQAIYGMYYPCNPCILRKNLEKLNNIFLDPHFTAYYADPDLALRVIDAGGRTDCCPTAWMESINEFDTVEDYKRQNYFELDHNKFIKRWHSKYGKNISSESSEINKGIYYLSEGVPQEKCSRLVYALKNLDLNIIKETCYNNLIYNQDHLSTCFLYFLMRSRELLLDRVLLRDLFIWFIEELFKLPTEKLQIDYSEIFTRDRITSIKRVALLAGVYFLHRIALINNRKQPYIIALNYNLADLPCTLQFDKMFFTSHNQYQRFRDFIADLDVRSSGFLSIDYKKLENLENSLLINSESFYNSFASICL